MDCDSPSAGYPTFYNARRRSAVSWPLLLTLPNITLAHFLPVARQARCACPCLHPTSLRRCPHRVSAYGREANPRTPIVTWEGALSVERGSTRGVLPLSAYSRLTAPQRGSPAVTSYWFGGRGGWGGGGRAPWPSGIGARQVLPLRPNTNWRSLMSMSKSPVLGSRS
jgi:hypothetical protein